MKKIGIITICRCGNFGAELQAFALQNKLNRIGYDAEIIDYIFYKNRNHRCEKASQPSFHYPFKLRVREFLLPIIEWWHRFKDSERYAKREAAFEGFHERYSKFSERQYCTYTELYENSPRYDVYCTGSDQVWNPGVFSSLDPYFLTFAGEGKKISYASSFGVSSLPDYAKEYYAKRLNAYSHIGLREKGALRIVNSLTEVETRVVADPTLLLNAEEWAEVGNSKVLDDYGIRDKYLLIYELRANQQLRQLAKEVAKRRGLQMVRICSGAVPIETDGSILNIVTAGPSEFVTLFANASFIVTNSFHGTAFSINFSRDFYIVTERSRANNSRQENLLDMCGLKERIVYDDMELPKAEGDEIEYGPVQARLASVRQESIDYLVHSIEE